MLESLVPDPRGLLGTEPSQPGGTDATPSLLALPDELLMLICEYLGPWDERSELYQLLPVKWLHLVCKRFGFLAELRYLLLEWRCGRFVFTSMTLDHRDDGPSYWLDSEHLYCGYCVWANGECIYAVHPRTRCDESTVYIVEDAEYAHDELGEQYYYAIVFGMYDETPIPADMVLFFEQRIVHGTKRFLIAQHGFPLLAGGCPRADPHLVAMLRPAPAEECDGLDYPGVF